MVCIRPWTSRTFFRRTQHGFLDVGIARVGLRQHRHGNQYPTTILCMSLPGDELGKMPLFRLAQPRHSRHVILAITRLRRQQVMLLVDRYLAATSSIPKLAASSVVWMHFFWISGIRRSLFLPSRHSPRIRDHPLVLPQAIFGYPVMVAATIGIWSDRHECVGAPHVYGWH